MYIGLPLIASPPFNLISFFFFRSAETARHNGIVLGTVFDPIERKIHDI